MFASHLVAQPRPVEFQHRLEMPGHHFGKRRVLPVAEQECAPHVEARAVLQTTPEVGPVTIDAALRYRKFDSTYLRYIQGDAFSVNDLPVTAMATDRSSSPRSRR